MDYFVKNFCSHDWSRTNDPIWIRFGEFNSYCRYELCSNWAWSQNSLSPKTIDPTMHFHIGQYRTLAKDGQGQHYTEYWTSPGSHLGNSLFWVKYRTNAPPSHCTLVASRPYLKYHSTWERLLIKIFSIFSRVHICSYKII